MEGRKLVCSSCFFKSSFALADSVRPCSWLGSYLRWLQIGLFLWLAKVAANLSQQRQQQHLQLQWHWLLRWWWQYGSGRGGSIRAAAASCTPTVGAAGCGLVGARGVLRLHPCSLCYALVQCAHCSGFALAARATRCQSPCVPESLNTQ